VRELEDYNPAAVLAYFLAVTLTAMFTMNPVMLALSLAGAAALFTVKNREKRMRAHLPYLALFLVSALVNPIFSHNGATVLFVVNDSPVTLEAFLYGVDAAAMITAVLYWFRSFSQGMTSDRLLYLFGAASPKLALVFSMALRYAPLFRAQAGRIGRAQKGLGLYRENNAPDTMRGGVRIFSVLVTWALENGIITADSMDARGYGTGRRTFYSLYRFRRCDAVLLAAVLALFSVSAAGVFSGALSFAFYPEISAAGLSPLACAACAAYGLLAFLPVILEAGEALRWKSLRSNI
jgi:energy-coupling factor transport system permease protein